MLCLFNRKTGRHSDAPDKRSAGVPSGDYVISLVDTLSVVIRLIVSVDMITAVCRVRTIEYETHVLEFL